MFCSSFSEQIFLDYFRRFLRKFYLTFSSSFSQAGRFCFCNKRGIKRNQRTDGRSFQERIAQGSVTNDWLSQNSRVCCLQRRRWVAAFLYHRRWCCCKHWIFILLNVAHWRWLEAFNPDCETPGGSLLPFSSPGTSTCSSMHPIRVRGERVSVRERRCEVRILKSEPGCFRVIPFL